MAPPSSRLGGLGSIYNILPASLGPTDLIRGIITITMRTIFLVTQEEVAKARALEQKLIALPPASGILFVSVSVEPANDLSMRPIYRVFVGCSPEIEPASMKALIMLFLKEEVEKGELFAVAAHRGVCRKVVDAFRTPS